MDKRQLGEDLPRIRLEIAAMKILCHQNICKLLQVKSGHFTKLLLIMMLLLLQMIVHKYFSFGKKTIFNKLLLFELLINNFVGIFPHFAYELQ